jgi:hypothetical protein
MCNRGYGQGCTCRPLRVWRGCRLVGRKKGRRNPRPQKGALIQSASRPATTTLKPFPHSYQLGNYNFFPLAAQGVELRALHLIGRHSTTFLLYFSDRVSSI